MKIEPQVDETFPRLVTKFGHKKSNGLAGMHGLSLKTCKTHKWLQLMNQPTDFNETWAADASHAWAFVAQKNLGEVA